MYCPNCGNRAFNMNYCSKCGTKLVSNNKYEQVSIPSYQTLPVQAISANNKIHKQIVIIDHLPLLVVVGLISIVVFGILIYVAISTF